MSNNKLPLISCICLTYNRVAFLKKSIACFLAQTYLNKELVILFNESDVETAAYLRSNIFADVVPVAISADATLSIGELRNKGIALCRGEYFCQWDDDDWHHNQRLERQHKAARENFKSGSLLGYWLLFDKANQQAYISHYGAWAGSILHKKNTGNRYPALNKKEDSVFIKQLFAENSLVPLICPVLYIYVYHGKNTWDNAHFNHMFTYSKKLSATASTLIGNIADHSISVDEGSALLLGKEVQEEMDFFYFVDPAEPIAEKGILHRSKAIIKKIAGSIFSTRNS